MTPLNLTGLPWPLSRHIALTLANQQCTPDHALLMADALDEYAKELSPGAPYHANVLRVANELRARAAHFTAQGKPLGDFDGTLTP